MHNAFDLSGRVALVTGASSGIGAATAIRLAELGAQVALGYHGNEQGARQATDTIANAGGRAIVLKADVRKVGEIRGLVDRATEALGPIDILVNNAGSLVARFPIRELTEAGWHEVLSLNLTSAVFAAQAVAASMIERKRGAIVNLGSIAGHNGGGPGAGPTPPRRPDWWLSPSRWRRSWRRTACASTPCHRASSTRRFTRCSRRLR